MGTQMMTNTNARFIIPPKDWAIALADAVSHCADGDVIVVRNPPMLALGMIAQKRMCPDKTINWEIDKDD